MGDQTATPITRVGADTGGTFTDLVGEDGSITKVLSTPDDPGRAVREGLDGLGAGSPRLLAHGTTVATNALLERRGAVVTLITNEGFGDLIEIARQDRPSLYDPDVDRPAPLVDRDHRLEVRGRLDHRGRELIPLDLSTLGDIPADTEAVAVCLLHADVDPVHEQTVAGEIRSRGFDVTCSHEVSPEFREYERTVTTVANAYLRPACREYLRNLSGLADEVLVMTSAGGLTEVGEASELPVSLLLSGPAGGVRAAAAIAAANGHPDAISFDMGGTSTDVCLIRGGLPEPAAGREVGGFPIRMPSFDIHTIGAGGGSVAAIDAGGALTVGPRSAGAVPGPACYGRGGTLPTVTDANLVAGRIPADVEFPSLGRLDLAAATDALGRAGVTAEGVLAVVDVNMEAALRAVSVERGVDPRGLALVAFGGAGPLHACALADALDMPAVIIPARAGVLSAVGLLCAPPQRDLVRSWVGDPGGPELGAAREELAATALARLGGEGRVETLLDCRYGGQSHEITVGSLEEFHRQHEMRNGYSRPDWPVEVVAIRARAHRRSPLRPDELPATDRRGGTGPTVISEPDCTIWVPRRWRARPGEAGALVLERTGEGS